MERIHSSGDEQQDCGMSKMLQALQDLQRENQELAAENARLKELEADDPLKLRAENAALKKQITLKNISWGEERKKMVEMVESSTSVLLKSKEEVTSFIQLVESEKAKGKKLEMELSKLNMSFKVKEEEVVSLKLQEDKLRAENAALKKQITLKNISWEEERRKMIETMESSTSVLLKSKDEMTSLIQLVENEKAKGKKLEMELSKLNMSFKVKEEEVVSLKLQEDKLRAENAALKKQITLKNISWEEERRKMIETLESSTSVLLKSKDELTSLIQLAESEKAKGKKLEMELSKMNMSFRVKEDEVLSLDADLKLQEDKLWAEIPALKKQITLKNISWEEERKKMIKTLESSTSVLLKSKDELTSLIQLVESEKAKGKKLEMELSKLNMSFKVKEEEVVSLKLQEDKLRAENAALKKQITLKNISWGEERKKMIETLESSTSVLLKSKDELTSLIQLAESEKAKGKKLEMELSKLNMSFKVKEEEVVSLNADLKLQEDKLWHFILENEGRPEEIEELQKIKLEEGALNLPIQQNIMLQALNTNSFKEKEEKMEKREKEEIEGTRRLPCFLFNLETS